MSILRKLFAGISVLAMVAMVTPAGAITVEELNAQIAALTAQIAALQGTTTTTTTSGGAITGVPAGFSFATNLKVGSVSQDVVYLKKVLDVEVPTHGAWSGTSYFGPLVKAAVIAFQEKYASDCLASFGLTSGTGFVGAATRAKLNTILATGSTTTTTTTTTPTGAGLTVTLASDTPAAGTLVRDDTTAVAQANVNFTKFVFTNGDNAEVNVTTLKLKRGGISADTDLSNVYLYDGTTQLAEYSAFSSQIVTFNNAAGLFTVPAGGSRTITVKGDLTAVDATVASISFGINASTDVTTNASAVNGTFPLAGNNMAVAAVDDLGYINIPATYTTYPTTLDPGVTNYTLWQFSMKAESQDMQIEKLIMTVVGTISATDIQNVKLEVGGVAVTDATQLASDKTVTFDFSANPYKIIKGQTKTFYVKGDVPTGTGRTFKFTIRKVSDLTVKDTQYGVYVKPLVNAGAFVLVEPTAGVGTTINNGSLTINTASDSPSGNVAAGATGVSLAKFNVKANGEAIKITNIGITVNEGDHNSVGDNGKLYYNGSQVGATDVLVADNEEYVFNTTIVIPAGETGVFEYKTDITTGGTALDAGQTLVASLNTHATRATGQSSLANIAMTGTSGRTLTVASGLLSVAKNNSMASFSSSQPTGVKGAAGVKVGSFVITAGAGEGVTVTQIVVGDEAGVGGIFGSYFQNLKLMHGTTQIGTTLGTLSTADGADFSFSPSPAITLTAGQQYVVDAYADILSSASTAFTATPAPVGLEAVSVTATGVLTSSSASWSTTADLQALYIAVNGSLSVTAVSGSIYTPVAGQLVMGSSDNVFAVFSFTAGAAEDISVSKIIITDTTNFGGSLANLSLINNGAGNLSTQIGSTVVALSDAKTATFELTTPWVIPANTTYYLSLKSGVGTYQNAVSGSSHILSIADADALTSYGTASGVDITETVTNAASNLQDVYRTKVTAIKNASTPSGSSVAGAGSTVLRFDVNSTSYTGALNSVAITMSGTAVMSGSGNAGLYDASAPGTALATETYRTPTCTGGDTTLTVSSTTGIPVGANVMVNVDGTTVTREVVSITSGTVLVVDSAITGTCGAGGDTDYVYYRPMQPGSGKVYFGAHTTLTADLADAVTSIAVTSTDGFAYGDTITFVGYTSAGVLVSGAASITSITDANTLGFSAGVAITGGATISYNYLSGGTYANAVNKWHNSPAVVYEGTGTNGSINKQLPPGNTIFIVKGDTTGAASTKTLRAEIATAADFVWSDSLSWTINTDTVTFPVPLDGGTLTY